VHNQKNDSIAELKDLNRSLELLRCLEFGYKLQKRKLLQRYAAPGICRALGPLAKQGASSGEKP
jgi:hypothetical protein